MIDAYVFIRSYQESEKERGSVVAALDHNDSQWRERELIIFPSHVTDPTSPTDIDKMIEAAHTGGFDAICATIIFTGVNPEPRFADIWKKGWNKRWTIPNVRIEAPDTHQGRPRWTSQIEALGRELWVWICRGLAS